MNFLLFGNLFNLPSDNNVGYTILKTEITKRRLYVKADLLRS